MKSGYFLSSWRNLAYEEICSAKFYELVFCFKQNSEQTDCVKPNDVCIYQML
jgi:hypothetical protein